MYINSFNGEYKMSWNCFYSLFIQTKINKQQKKKKQSKTVVKIHESL